MSRSYLIKGGAFILALLMFLTVIFPIIGFSNIHSSIYEPENTENIDSGDTGESPLSTEYNITTFSDGSSEKKTVFGNLLPVNETVYFKIPKEAANNVTSATMQSSGLTHNLRNVINGENNNDNFGFNVSCTGDINNDSYADVVVGAPGWNGNKGIIYIYYGNESGISPAYDAITGENTGDMFGHSVSGGCDVNNDGYDDVVVGAPNWNAGTGKVYVFYGYELGMAATYANQTSTYIAGEASGDKFGFSVSNAGNINGDSYDDIIAGAPYNDNAAKTNNGAMYIFKGTIDGITATSASQADIKHGGDVNEDALGICVSDAGDVNDDDFDDVIVGAPMAGGTSDKGYAYIYLGRATGSSLTRKAIRGESWNDYFGFYVSSAGNINDDKFDEFDDVIIGAPGHKGGGNKRGRVYIFHGNITFPSIINAEDADTKINGLYDNEQIGKVVSGAGNVNNDGYDDVIVGTHRSSSDMGKIWIFHGSKDGIDAVDVGDASTTIHGEEKEENFGHSVSSAGDINKDGYIDIIVGAPYSDAGGTDYGTARIYFGSSSGISNMPATLIDGEIGKYTEFGFSVSSAGDVDNDGFEEVIIGAYKNNSYAGRIYIYRGSVIGVNSLMTIIECGTERQRFGYSVAHANVNNDAYDDIIIGAPGNLTGEGGYPVGRVYIFHGSSAGITATHSSQANTIIEAEAVDHKFGFSVSCAGKVNNDDYDDIIVGAPGWGKFEVGQAYVFHGSSSGITQTSANAADKILNVGNKYAQFGRSVSSAGDVNNDGYDDVIVGEPYYPQDNYIGRAYVFHGSSTGISDTPSTTLNGENLDDNFGRSVSAAGNVNGDSWDDVVVGAPFYDTSNSNTGKIYVYHGSASGTQSSAATTITGQTTKEHFGIAVSNAGNIDQDIYDDVIVGADGWPDDSSGKAYIFLGSSSGLSTNADTEINGEYPGDFLGTSVASAGDVNGDTYCDVIVSAPSSDAGSPPTQKGRVYVAYGFSSGLLWWDSDYIPRDPKVDVTANGTYEWIYDGYYTSTQAIVDFSDELNYYLATHQQEADLEGNILVPINVTCNSRGTIMLDNVNITWTSSGDLEVGPPMNINAQLEGENLKDVRMTWTLSKDDGGGENDVSNYAVYRSTTYESNGLGYEFFTEIPQGTSYYVDIDAGDIDPNNYFYYVQANDTSNNINWSGQAGKFSRQLSVGRQLVSIPLVQSDTNIVTVLQTIDGNYNNVQWYDSLNTEDHWKTYSTIKPSGSNDLLNVDHKIALWITMVSEDNLIIAGKIPSSISIQLYEGWNFVGYPSLIDRTVGNALNGITYEQVEGFDESAPPYYLKILADSDLMTAGDGYWIRVTEDCEWVVYN